MSWGSIKPFLVDLELYSSLLVNTYAVLFATLYAVRWLAGRARNVKVPASDVLSNAFSDAFTLLIMLALVAATIMTFFSLVGGLDVPPLGEIIGWITAQLS